MWNKKTKGSGVFCLGLAIAILLAFSPLFGQRKSEIEHNDSREQAQEIRIGETIEGSVQRDYDDDWYKLIIDKSGNNYLQVDVSAIPEIDTELSLYDANGQRLIEVNDAAKNEAETIAHFPVQSGVYYILVDLGGKATQEKYTLTTKITGPWQEGWESEPNDSQEKANELKLGQSVKGYFNRKDDNDYYKLTVEASGKTLVQIDLSAVPGVNGELDLYDDKGRKIWSVDETDKSGPESIFNLALAQGIYYIYARAWEANTKDPYTLITKFLGPWQEGTEAEPNNEIKLANEIKLNAPFKGRINASRDDDYFLLNVPSPGVDLMIIQLSGVPGVRWNLELLDPKEERLDYSWRGETGEGEEIVKMKFKPGTYYLEVEVRGGKNTGAEYTLYAGKPQKPPATPQEVNQALVKALDWLASKQQKNGTWPRYETAYAGLSLMAFIGAKCVEKDYSANIKGAISYLKSQYEPRSKYTEGSRDADRYGGTLGTDNMYEHAIATLGLVEALVDLNDSSLEPIAQEAINLILRSQNTEHKPPTLGGPVKPDSQYYGGWRYSPESEDSDISITGWQILALKAAVNAGFSVPDHVFATAAKFVRSLQGKKDGSFNYDSPGEEGRSCARAGMGTLSLQLCGFPQDPAIAPALRFMQDYAPRWNEEEPGSGYPFYYWYYGTRAMFLSGGDDWRIWKDWMCRFLIDHQNPDGSWDGAEAEEDLDTYRVALGALMLEFCCGHVPVYMSPVKRLGSGFIRVDFEKGAEKEAIKNVQVIMDASNSMWGQIGGEAKITIARRVLAQIISGLPETMNVGLRVYGHRYGMNDPRACTDTELLVPIGPVDKKRLIDTVNKIQLKGKTPLVFSVLEAIKDFEKIPSGSIILVTDGIESCGGDIKSIGPAIRKSGLEIEVHIVGFDIKEKEGRAELEAIAKSTEGRYLDAKDANELLSALEQTLRIEYVILGEKGEEVGRGLVGGDEVKLKEGNYVLRVLLAPEPLETKITIKAGSKLTSRLRKEADIWKLTI